MGDLYVFADEAGCFTFRRQAGASAYFVLCTLRTADCGLSHELLQIRRDGALAGRSDANKLHATTDPQSVRDRVYQAILSVPFEVDVTVLEKCKAPPEIAANHASFYGVAWSLHLAQLRPSLLTTEGRVLLTAASLGPKRNRAVFKGAVNNVLQGMLDRHRWEIAFLESSQDPMLWAADYCAWAIQRFYERNDERAFQLIQPRIKSLQEPWRHQEKIYY